MSHTPVESWWTPDQRDAMLRDLLHMLKTAGPLDNDQLARACVPIDELVGSIPATERRRRAEAMTNALIEYLEDQNDLKLLEPTAKLWHQSIERARALLRWRELPPVVARLAILHADTLIRYALRHNYVTRYDLPTGPVWRLSAHGHQALNDLSQKLTSPAP
ncbi:hypothetical protein [Mucisphaera sp.]|uniref:hypothetical protein n=1 Tax=Mucisphaera sp. TaxID=2913024 RepID=UPI003D12DE82